MHTRQLRQRRLGRLDHALARNAELLQHHGHRARFLLAQRQQQVLGPQLLMGVVTRDALGALQRFLGLDGVPIEGHGRGLLWGRSVATMRGRSSGRGCP